MSRKFKNRKFTTVIFRFKKGNWAEAFIELGTSIDIYYNDEALTNPFEEPLEK